MRTRKNVVQKTQSRCKEDAATQFKSFRQQSCLIHRHFQKSETSFTTSEVQGEAPWLDSTPAICPAEIPVPNAASRSRDPIGLRVVLAALRSSGSAVLAIIALKRSPSTRKPIRIRSRPEPNRRLTAGSDEPAIQHQRSNRGAAGRAATTRWHA